MTTKKPKLSIIIVSYNTREMALECIRSVFRETKTVTFEIIVLDNDSQDNSYNAIADEFGDRIRLISSSQNLGFAGGNNRAIEQAGGEFLLLLNPDTVVLDGAIDRLIGFAAQNPNAGIWGGRTQFADLTLNPASCWSRQTLWSLVSQALGLSSIFRRSSLFNPEGMGGWNREGEREVDIVSGCFLLIRRELWQQLNGFHPDFFMYGEEADLCLRAKFSGARPMVTSTATIIHYGGASERVRADKMVRLLNAKCLLIKRHFSPALTSAGVALLAVWPLSRWLAHSLLAGLGRSRSREPTKVWREIWTRKKEWV